MREAILRSGDLNGKVERLGFAVQRLSLKLWALWHNREPIGVVGRGFINSYPNGGQRSCVPAHRTEGHNA
jgi:hypothetical protein